MSENEEYISCSAENELLRLRADCGQCFGLCCAALPFAKSSDFAMDKAAGQPCHNLKEDFRCGIHSRLRDSGMRGCTVYDCFGAGQKVSMITYSGVDWREAPSTAALMFEVFPVMRQLHELLWYMTEALSWPAAAPVHAAMTAARDTTEQLTLQEPEAVLKLDIPGLRYEINELLLQASELTRQAVRSSLKPAPARQKNYGRGADLIGARMKKADLRCVSLRGAYLIAADLSGADLRAADLIGADFRDTNICGADLSTSLFLTQFQVNAAKGDAATRLPATLARPDHWSSR